MQSVTIFNFKEMKDLQNWRVIDDAVMGGQSSGALSVDKEGYGVFKGTVSLANNGGFSLLRYRFNKRSTKPFSKIILKVKGDGKTYQFRIKSKSSDAYSYVTYFTTTQKWQNIAINLAEMYPAFRGRKLDIPNYNKTAIEEIAFLIGNKKAEDFTLNIAAILFD
ncbi:CIA30 family protein [Polaribacter sp. DS7-9]|nr:CIA30 family protein [Polaribacter sp. DS7-9]